LGVPPKATKCRSSNTWAIPKAKGGHTDNECPEVSTQIRRFNVYNFVARESEIPM